MTETYAYLNTADLEALRVMHRQNLALLAGQAAKFGDLYIPPPLHHQIEDAKNAIDVINQEFPRCGIQIGDPPPGAPLKDSVNGLIEADFAQKQELAQLLEQLQVTLATTPADQREAAETVAEMAKDLVEKAAQEKPNKTSIRITGEGLKNAATNLAGVLPTVLSIATQIIQAVQKLIMGSI